MADTSIIHKIRCWGINSQTPEQERRAIELSNLLALLVSGLSFLVVVVLNLVFGWVPAAPLTIFCGCFYLGLLLLNRAGYTHLNRLLQSIFLPAFAIIASIIVKRDEPYIEEPEYFDTRLLIVISAIIPLVLFGIKRERKSLIIALSWSFLLLVFYDSLHNLFQVGYYQTGHNAANYAFARVLFIILYILLVVSFLYYKLLLERTENQLRNSHEEISELNKGLQSQNEEIIAQHEEMQAQAEELEQSREMLFAANKTIEQQNQQLEAENTTLSQHLLEKNELLEESNISLQKRLEEVRQFSYTISHNLRGPVASLLGLFNLIDKEKAHPENLPLLDHALTTAKLLDEVILDLSQMLQLRDASISSEVVNIRVLLDIVLASLRTNLEDKAANIALDLEVEEIHSHKSYLHSILYNLLSNAIKHADNNRALKITVTSKKIKNTTFLSVHDNGAGIDLAQHEHNMFKMYKRFNLNKEGRGLGLYLIKVQTEALGGRVTVASQLGQGTTFTISLPDTPS